jgi:hypothetical protein
VPLSAGPALASTSQVSIMEVGTALEHDPGDSLNTARLLGVRDIRLVMHWQLVAPDPHSRRPPTHFNGADPGDYPASAWAIWDTIIKTAHADGIAVDLNVAGRAPLWAMPKSAPVSAQGSRYPSTNDYRQFVEAVAKRYSGSYVPRGASTPLPRVTFWSIWNEPNYVSSLAPQARGPNNSIPVSPLLYRGILAAGWNALSATGHGHDTILIGELAPRGDPHAGHGYTYPVLFVRALYCDDPNYHHLRGAAAAALGCPTTAAASAQFRANNPALFNASGFSDHPYSRNGPPNTELFADCATNLCGSLGDLPYLIAALDRSVQSYGSTKTYPLYSTEYGYQTSPPKHDAGGAPFVSLSTAAQYINWAEYFSYMYPRIASYDQFMLDDPLQPTAANNYGDGPNFATGIETWNGHPKPGFGAFRLPLFLPHTTAPSAGSSLEVWGCVRPAYYAGLDTGGVPQTVNVQFAPTGSHTFSTIDTITITNPAGYFDTYLPFSHSGTVRLQYTYPLGDLLLAPAQTVYSRNVTVTVL